MPNIGVKGPHMGVKVRRNPSLIASALVAILHTTEGAQLLTPSHHHGPVTPLPNKAWTNCRARVRHRLQVGMRQRTNTRRTEMSRPSLCPWSHAQSLCSRSERAQVHVNVGVMRK